VFQDERAQLRAIVDNQLRSTQSLVTDEWRAVSLPRIVDPPTTGPQAVMDPSRAGSWDPNHASGTPPGVRSDPPMEGSDPRSDPRISRPSDPRMADGHGSDPRRIESYGSDPRRMEGHGSDPRSDPRLAFRDGTPVTGPSGTSQLAVATGSLPAPMDPRARRLRLVAVSSVVALVTVGLGVFLVAQGSSRGPASDAAAGMPERVSASTVTVPATAAPAAPEPVPPAVVTVTIQASPPEARLLLDGKPLDGNPFKGTLPRDGAEHALRVEASGHEPLERTLRLERDITMSLALTREPVATPQVRRPVAPQPQPDPEEMKPKPRPKRPLDDENPYAAPTR
jgi:hypothetical protein